MSPLSQRRTALLLLSILLVAIISPSSLFHTQVSIQKSTLNDYQTVPEGQSRLQSLPRLGGHAPLSSSDPYNEQLGISFTQNFTSLAYTVTAVEQSGTDGYGPAYLLNGLSNTGYWYQVGLSYNWSPLSFGGLPSVGFKFVYEVFEQPQGFWIDNGASYSVTNPLPSSTASERWQSNSAVEGNASSPSAVSASYYHQYYVSIEPNPATGGSVSVGSGWFDAVATFRATASANAGWQFKGWNGSGEGSYSGASSTASTVVGASFVETATFYLGLTIVSSSGISVSYSYGATAGSIPAGTSQTIFAPQRTNITLTASPKLFIYSFDGWTGSTTSSGSTISVVLNSPLSLTANYSFNYVNIGILSAVAIAAVAVFAITIRRVKGGSHQRRRGPRHLHDKKSKF
jgi:hypothetical protein